MLLVFCLCKLIQRLLCSKHNYASMDNAGQIFGDFYFNVFLFCFLVPTPEELSARPCSLCPRLLPQTRLRLVPD